MESATTTKARLEIHRDVKQRVLGGVAAGLGRSLGIEPVYVRAGFVSLGLVYGLGLVLYLGLWAILPEEPSPTLRPSQRSTGVNGSGFSLSSPVHCWCCEASGSGPVTS